MNQPYRKLPPLARRIQSFRCWLRALCVELACNEWFFFALMADCVALVVFWLAVTG